MTITLTPAAHDDYLDVLDTPILEHSWYNMSEDDIADPTYRYNTHPTRVTHMSVIDIIRHAQTDVTQLSRISVICGSWHGVASHMEQTTKFPMMWEMGGSSLSPDNQRYGKAVVVAKPDGSRPKYHDVAYYNPASLTPSGALSENRTHAAVAIRPGSLIFIGGIARDTWTTVGFRVIGFAKVPEGNPNLQRRRDKRDANIYSTELKLVSVRMKAATGEIQEWSDKDPTEYRDAIKALLNKLSASSYTTTYVEKIRQFRFKKTFPENYSFDVALPSTIVVSPERFIHEIHQRALELRVSWLRNQSDELQKPKQSVITASMQYKFHTQVPDQIQLRFGMRLVPIDRVVSDPVIIETTLTEAIPDQFKMEPSLVYRHLTLQGLHQELVRSFDTPDESDDDQEVTLQEAFVVYV